MSKAVIPDTFQGLPVVTAAQMTEIDQRATKEFGIPSLHLMENAGKGVAQEVLTFIKEKLKLDPATAMITICCGRGNKGGDGLVAARHLKELGAMVVVYIAPPRREGGYTSEVVENLRRATVAGVLVQELGEDSVDLDVRLRSSAVVIDALLGTGASGKPTGLIRTMIQRMMKSGKPIIAIDIPSGIHPDTGYHSGVFVTATMTLTMGLPKRGLLAAHAQRNVGELRVIDIGLPKMD